MTKWISVEDRLPDNTDDVLLTDGDESYVVGWWRKVPENWRVCGDLIEYRGSHLDIIQAIKYWSVIDPPD